MTSKRANRRRSHPVFKAIAASERRELLRLLLVRDGRVSEKACVAHLAATQPQPTAEKAGGDRRSIQIDLTHNHLPLLEDAGLIRWNRDEATVATASHPAFDDPRFQPLLDLEGDGLDTVLLNLANERRRILITILRDERNQMSRTALAEELLRRETGGRDPEPDAVGNVVVSLHHAHLPTLADAKLAEYDPESGSVRYRRHPVLEDLFTIIYEPDKYLAESYDGFFEGWKEAYTNLKGEADMKPEWPHGWRNPSYE